MSHELNLASNFSNLLPEFQDAAFDPGRRYSMPYTWLTLGIAYRKSAMRNGQVPNSWRYLFDSNQYSGRIALLSESADLIRLCAKYLGHSVNNIPDEMLTQIEQMLIRQKPHIKAFHEDDGQDLLASGEIDIVLEYNGDIAQLVAGEGGDQFDFVIPQEGTLINSDCLCIPTGAPNLEEAHAFINYLLDAEAGQKITEEIQYPTPNAAVRDRMVADVPLGAFLSGGVDSSSVVALMAEASSKAVKTCTIGFDEASLDETAFAQQIADRFATDHRSRIVAADDFTLIDRIADHFDEPFADASALPTLRVCELAREEVAVALSGDGADEAFAGYRRHVFQHQEERLRGFLPAPLRRSLLGPLGRVWPQMDWAPRPLRARATLASLARDGATAYAEAVGVTAPATRARLFNDAARTALGDHVGEARYWQAMATAPAREPLDRAQYADLKIWLPGDILTKTDRMSMAVSLEAREPLLDYRLVEFAASLPAAMRVSGGQGKAIMKRAMEAYLPRDILYRPKMGFVTPISAWFRGPLAQAARTLATSATLTRAGWFDMAEVGRIVTAHQAGRRDHGRTIWQLMMLERSLVKLFGI